MSVAIVLAFGDRLELGTLGSARSPISSGPSGRGPSEQSGHADQIVGGHRQREAVAHALEAVHLHLVNAGDGLGPTERFLD